MAQVVLLSPKTSEHQKKGLHQKLKDLSPLNRLKTKKKSLLQFGSIFGQNWWDFFALAGTFSSDHPAWTSHWGDAKS